MQSMRLAKKLSFAKHLGLTHGAAGVLSINTQLPSQHRRFADWASGGSETERNNRHGSYWAGVASVVVVGAAAIGIYSYFDLKNRNVLCEAQAVSSKFAEKHKTPRTDLPTFKSDEISKHNNSSLLIRQIQPFILISKIRVIAFYAVHLASMTANWPTSQSGIWVTYGIGVYDITKFVPEHPGSADKVMMAAGSAIDPFWHVFQQHNTPQVLQLLESFRIGNLHPDDEIGTADLDDPWANEPKRNPILIPASKKPFNAEPPPALLTESLITPEEFFYVRNHLPVPDIDPSTYELEIEIVGTDKTKMMTLDAIKKLPKHSVQAAIMCGGNRRSEMHKVKEVKGLSWGTAAVGNGLWSGPKLCDILTEMGVESDEVRHVHLEGLDTDPTATPYAASIPLSKAMDPRGDVILAYEMNGKPLSRDHGYPVRVVVPGVVGARNVKWVGRITVSPFESDSHWQQNDYKGFSPSTDWDTVDFTKSPAIQHMPVTSAICTPVEGSSVKVNDNNCIEVKGYAWSGGGNRIVRVDITADGGKSWHVAELEQEDVAHAPAGRHWGWSLWSARIPVLKGCKEVEIWSKAVDSNYNVQPESFENIWTLRGVLSNAYHRVKVKVSA